jgi:hypothetical protein
MSLRLHQNEAELPNEDYDVMHGGLRVGRIWNSPAATPDMQWLWSLNGVFSGPDANLRHSGLAGTLANARAHLSEEWLKWLKWANLREAPGSDAGAAAERESGSPSG